MDKEEIKDYLKRVDELGAKLTGEDRETLAWLIYGCNQCAKLLNETEQQCKKQKEVIDKVNEFIKELYDNTDDTTCYEIDKNRKVELLDILKEVSE